MSKAIVSIAIGTLFFCAGLGQPATAQTARDQVAQAAAEHFAVERTTVGIVGDADQFIDDLRQRWPQVEIVARSSLDLDQPSLGLDPQ